MQGYKACSVFDISQTDGEPVPEYIHDLSDPVAEYFSFFSAIEQSSPVPIRFENVNGGVHGYYSPVGKEIVINRGMSEMQTLKTLVHEISHARLDHGSKEDTTDKRTKEVQAESIAYCVCDSLGLDTSDYSFAYIAGWSSDKNLKELKESLEIIGRESSKLSQEIIQRMQPCIERNMAVEGSEIEPHRMKMAM